MKHPLSFSRIAAMLALILTAVFAFPSMASAMGGPDMQVCYAAFVQNSWQNQVCNYANNGDPTIGPTAGTTGQSLPLEAIKIWITHPLQREGICYQAYVEVSNQNPPTVCDGAVAGMAGPMGQVSPLEAIKIWITHPLQGEDIYYQAHVQHSGWQQPWGHAGSQIGTIGQSLDMEAIRMTLKQSQQSLIQ